MAKPELLAPAGNLAKLKCAFRFGADAKDEYLTMVDFEVKPIHELVGVLDAKKGEEVKRYIENEYKK